MPKTMNNLPDNLAQLKESLSVVSDQLPLAALQEAVAQREILTPVLLEALQAMQIPGKRDGSPSLSRLPGQWCLTCSAP